MKARFSNEQHRERWTSVGLFLLLVLCYTYTLPRWADPNQNSRLDMVVAVVDEGTFRIDEYVENTVDYAKVGGPLLALFVVVSVALIPIIWPF